MNRRHAMDPFQVRRLAAAVGVDERTGAYAVSLALTVGVAVACAGVGALASAALPRLSPPVHNAAHNATGGAAADGADLWLQPLWAALTQPGHPSGLAPLTASPLFPGLASIAFYFLASGTIACNTLHGRAHCPLARPDRARFPFPPSLVYPDHAPRPARRSRCWTFWTSHG